ncbi:Thiamine-phosphate synthase [BD1-7 clade bacterium]|uniref:Thiamine-phosphate synthase n=1 Tax=BD1-7 clade bacterium TaxID=2029982 RepID=A0A5S9MMS5_9GAMM|nr:Thiamine-phosphate synthase [BD1-7 clade bacterium]CAA0085590.1 Thiamine-phosphate synthase [BD1-7 clade bacterium]
MKQPNVWSIAGSDCSGGAGIQADNQTIHGFDCHPCNVVTAVTAQNTQGVQHIQQTDEPTLNAQWDSLLQDYPPQAIKLGMLGDSTTINTISKRLASIKRPIVCDPVLKSTSGGSLMHDAKAYQQLFEQITLLTPNQIEFFQLFDIPADSLAGGLETLIAAAETVSQTWNINLVVTGGENSFGDEAVDVCVIEGRSFCMHSPFQPSHHTHGTGCSFSTAVAASLSRGYNLLDAVVLAKTYINQGLAQENRSEIAPAAFQHTRFPWHIDYLPSISARGQRPQVKFPQISGQLGCYPVVDSVMWIERCLEAGVKTIQLRVKDVADAELDDMIAQSVALGRQHQARVFINDYWQLAIKHGAYGIHLGQEDLDIADIQAIADAGIHLGVSNHSWFELARGQSLQPSYLAIGPIYETTTKKMPFAPQGLTQLQEWVRLIDSRYPLVAIGGIDLTNASEVLQTGVGSVAMVRAVTEADNYKKALAEFMALCGDC